MILWRSYVACFTLLLFALFCVPPLPAQESRWNELNAQVQNLFQQGKYTDALPIATEALKTAQATFGPADMRVGTALNNLAQIYDEVGNYAAAEPLFQSALNNKEHALGADHPSVATVLNNMAFLYYHQGR